MSLYKKKKRWGQWNLKFLTSYKNQNFAWSNCPHLFFCIVHYRIILNKTHMHQKKQIVFLTSPCPSTVKLGVAGFSMGASVALYSATCRALGQYGNGNRYPINLSASVALSGWLPCSRFYLCSLRTYNLTFIYLKFYSFQSFIIITFCGSHLHQHFFPGI